MRNLILYIAKRLIKLTNRDLYQKIKEGTFDDESDQLMRKNRIDLVIDVGANHGDFGARLIERGFKGPILSFEPMPETYAALKQRASAFPQWHCFQLALGEAEAKAVIHGHKEDVFNSLLQASDFGKRRYKTLNASIDVEVTVRRLDDILSSLIEEKALVGNFRAFLKVDTQGYDLNVIRGAQGFLAQILMLQTEASIKAIYEGSPDYLETISFLNHLGFQPASFNVLSREKDSGNIIEFDLLAQRSYA